MKLHELRAPQGASRKAKRKGRGQATGLGTTAGRGMNGQNSRSGGGVKLGFEGGQMPFIGDCQNADLLTGLPRNTAL